MLTFKQFLESFEDDLPDSEIIEYTKNILETLDDDTIDTIGWLLYTRYYIPEESPEDLIFKLEDVKYMLNDLSPEEQEDAYLYIFDRLYDDSEVRFEVPQDGLENEPAEPDINEAHARLLKITKRNRNKNAHFANMMTKGQARAKKQANKKIARLKRAERRKYARANVVAIKAYNKSYNAAIKAGKHIKKKYY